MPTVQIKANLTTGQLLKAVEQMPQEDLDRFVEQVFILRANQRAPRLSPTESELLERINQGLAAKDQQRFNQLVAKREIADLSDEENAEFLRLANLVEALNVERIKALVELARARRSTAPPPARRPPSRSPARAAARAGTRCAAPTCGRGS